MIFAYHGYPWLIHRLTYKRTNHDNIHVRGYKEEGTTTTPFDMAVLNHIDRFNLAIDVIDRVPRLAATSAGARELLQERADPAPAVRAQPGRGPARDPELGWSAAPGGRSSPRTPNATRPKG